MKLIKIFFTFFTVICFAQNISASTINTSVSSKYFDIFSKPILLNEDIDQYRKIICF